MTKALLLHVAKVFLITTAVMAGVFSASYFVAAFTEPSEAPPAGNVAAPLNVGSTAQTKAGGLGIGALGGGPLSTLHIKDGQTWGSDLSIDATGLAGGRRWLLISTGGNAGEGTGKFLIKDNTDGAGVRLTIDTAGKVGIGTAEPQAKLHVDGSVLFEGGSGDVNGDGIISSTDSLFITQYLSLQTRRSLTPAQMAAADVDGDGRVTDDDLYIISPMDLGVTKEEALRVVHGGYGVGCPSGFQSGLCSKRQFTIRDGNLAVGNVGVAAARLAIDTLGSAGDGIAVSVNSANSAIYAEQQGAGYAGYFSGKLHITDVLTLKEPRGGGPTIKLDPIRTNQNNTFQILRSDGSEAIGFDSASGTIRAGRLDLTTNIGSGNIVADSITANTTINSPQFCIGLDCKTAWTGIQPDTNLFLATGQHQYSWLGAATSVASIQSRINAGAGAGVSSAVLWWNPATNSWSNDTVPIGAAITFAISGGSKQVALPVSLNDNFGLTTGVLAANTGYFAGNVGIGTLAPGYKLSVVDTGLIPIINIWNNSVTNAWTGTRLARGGTGDETEKWFLGMNDSDDSLRFRSKGSTDDVIIDTDGNVAIAKKLKLGNAELYWDDRGTPATTDDRLVIKVNP